LLLEPKFLINSSNAFDRSNFFENWVFLSLSRLIYAS
jgi:hypothetical protein